MDEGIFKIDGLEHKVDLAIRLLRAIPQDSEIGLSYSGGKDSDVILELARMSGIPFRPIYKNTTIDPPGTIAHVRGQGVEVMQPEKTFFKLVEEKGSPSRFCRFCCSYLKEYKVCDKEIQGIRRCESVKRAKLYKEPEECRLYPKGGKARIYFPILEWTDEDVKEFIRVRGIKCAPVYYDGWGNFHVERRLGCIGCPLASQKKRREQFRQYPKVLKAYIRHLQKYLDAHTGTNAYKYCNGKAENKMFFELFCGGKVDDFDEVVSGGLFPEQAIDPKKFLEEYFKIGL